MTSLLKMTDLSQTPTEVLKYSLERMNDLKQKAARAGLSEIAEVLGNNLATISAELSRRQKDD